MRVSGLRVGMSRIVAQGNGVVAPRPLRMVGVRSSFGECHGSFTISQYEYREAPPEGKLKDRPMRLRWLAAAVLATATLVGHPRAPLACEKADFEAVVDEAAAALRDLNLKNRPTFQDKLRGLKDKRGWNHDQFMKEAAPFVADAKIAEYDQASTDLLTEISTLGQEGADASTPDCKLLAELRARMKTLVDTQTAKWAYMFGKLDAEVVK